LLGSQNPKYEYRNPKQYLISNIKWHKHIIHLCNIYDVPPCFEFRIVVIRICFGFRASCFEFIENGTKSLITCALLYSLQFILALQLRILKSKKRAVFLNFTDIWEKMLDITVKIGDVILCVLFLSLFHNWKLFWTAIFSPSNAIMRTVDWKIINRQITQRLYVGITPMPYRAQQRMKHLLTEKFEVINS
jgi:hypothetical protein